MSAGRAPPRCPRRVAARRRAARGGRLDALFTLPFRVYDDYIPLERSPRTSPAAAARTVALAGGGRLLVLLTATTARPAVCLDSSPYMYPHYQNLCQVHSQVSRTARVLATLVQCPVVFRIVQCLVSSEQCRVTVISVHSWPALGAATSGGTSAVLPGAPTPLHLRALAYIGVVTCCARPLSRRGIHSSYASTPT